MTMNPDVQARAILGRFGFNRRKAIQYCESIARMYPVRSMEYSGYIDAIQSMELVEVVESLNA